MLKIHAVLADPSTSNWLHIALTAALKRDCVDAAKDAELLASLLSQRAAAILVVSDDVPDDAAQPG